MESLSGLLLIILFAVIFIVACSSVFKIHPFISLLLACFIVGLGTRIPALQIIELITKGFGNIMSHIGLIVTLGTIIGIYLEQSGALESVSNTMLSFFGRQNSATAIAVMGSIIGVPVFCDSGFIILSKLSKIVAKKQGISTATTSLALASGLYTTHTLVPPTPGPIAAAGNIGASEHLGMIILVGLITAIPVSIVAVWFAKKQGASISVEDSDIDFTSLQESSAKMSFLWAITPIALPILLITQASVLKILGTEGDVANGLYFVGHPLTALLLGLAMAIIQIMPKIPLRGQSDLFGKGLVQAGPILLITGAGGAFGTVLQSTPLIDLLKVHIEGSVFSGVGFLLLVYGIAAMLKTAQGSSTSALIITSSLISPFVLLAGFSTGLELALVVMALGAGAMSVSHSNDSYFWIVTKLSGFSLKNGYRGFTLLTLLQGLTALMVSILVYTIFS